MNNVDLEKKIREIICELSDRKGFISSVDVLIQLNYLSQADYDNWRNGKIEYLEKVCNTNLAKLKTINQIISKISKKMKFEPSWTAYNKYGKGPKQRLQFCKSGNENIERAYSTHYVNKFRIDQNKDKIKNPAERIEAPAGNSTLA